MATTNYAYCYWTPLGTSTAALSATLTPSNGDTTSTAVGVTIAVTDGLLSTNEIVAFDAGDSSSYSTGTPSTWTNMGTGGSSYNAGTGYAAGSGNFSASQVVAPTFTAGVTAPQSYFTFTAGSKQGWRFTRGVADDMTLAVYFQVPSCSTATSGTQNFYEPTAGQLLGGDYAGLANDFGMDIYNCQIGYGTGGSSDSTVYAGSTASAPSNYSGVWHYGVVTRAKSTNGVAEQIKFYVDGSLVNTTTITTSEGVSLSAQTYNCVGCDPEDGRYFTGSVAVAQEYSAILTPAQISANYAVLQQRYEIQTTTTLAAATTKPSVGTPDPLTATISSSSATGTVAFYNGGNLISGCTSVAVSNGQATCPWTPSNAGSYSSFTASYSGDSTYAPSSSAPAATVTAISNAQIPGSIDYALKFNSYAPNYGQATDSTFNSTSVTFTAEAWVNPATSHGSGALMGVENNWLLNISSGTLYYAFYNNGWSSINTGIAMEQNQWQHIAFVRNGATVKLYKNGVMLYTAGGFATGIVSSSYPFAVGSRPSNGESFDGSVDQVEIWKSDRSANVATDMNTYPASETTNSSSNLIGLYDFNEGSGDIAYNRAYGATYGSNLIFHNTPIYQRVDTLSTNGGNNIESFPRTYLTSVGGYVLPYGVSTLSALVVGGGGAGGTNAGGGGSGGGVTATSSQSVGASHILNIQVGAGGPAQAGAVGCSITAVAGYSGVSSSITGTSISLSALGGTGGVPYPGSTVGAPGGVAPAGGGNGGRAAYNYSPLVAASDGASGTSNSITGASVTYGGGGGGGGWGTTYGSNGGSFGGAGGGGAGAKVNPSNTCSGNGSPGTANTGGGGGGGESSNGLGGDGGSGLVVISFAIANTNCATTSDVYDSQTVVVFKNVGSCTWSVPAGVTSINIFAVGGGGGGGQNIGNGGAGGSLGTLTSQSISAGTPITIAVGAGGTGSQTPGNVCPTACGNGSNGSATQITATGISLSEAGGTGGNGYSASQSAAPTGANGGGGGGSGSTASGGAPTAGGAGSSSYSWWGTATNIGQAVGGTYYFAGGGGGGEWNYNGSALGGLGGGGRGSNGYLFTTTCNDFNVNQNGAPNTGGGGGGGSGGGGSAGCGGYGGNGGSGVVMISYATSGATCNASAVQTTTINGLAYNYVQYTDPANSAALFNSCNSSWSVPTGVSTADFLVVAGGGGGELLGGGGGGGVIYQTNVAVSGSSVIRVGPGGAGSNFFSDNFNRATNGFNSSVLVNGATSLLAVGGGSGADDYAGVAATNGGSGGGEGPYLAGTYSTVSTPTSGVGTWGSAGLQGTQGGIGVAVAPSYAGGGGGGAGANPCTTTSVGGNAASSVCTFTDRSSTLVSTTGGTGGTGVAVSITGTTLCYGGGGGGGVVTILSATQGTGTCGGGNGAVWAANQTLTTAGTAGTNALGGGGGATYAGGAGTVIIRWQDPGTSTVYNSYPSSATAGLPALYARYLPQDFNTAADEWTDSSGNGYNAFGVSSGLQIGTTSANTNGVTKSIPVLTGTPSDGLLWPSSVLPTTYTMFSLIRYNSTDTTYTATDKNRILQSAGTANGVNWWSGNWSSCAGVSYHNGWMESWENQAGDNCSPSTIAAKTATDPAQNNWSLNTDQINLGAGTSLFRSDGVLRSDTPHTTTARLAINQLGYYTGESSDFQIADILVFNSALTAAQIVDVENYLANLYGVQGTSLQPGVGNVTPTTGFSAYASGNSTSGAGNSTMIAQYDPHPINTVTAFNQYTPPSAPTTRILTWNAPGDQLMASTDYSGYTIQYQVVGSSTWTTVTGLSLTGTSVRAVVTGLSANTNYKFSITPVATGLINAPTTTTSSQILYSSSANVATTYSPSTSYPNMSEWTTYIAGTGTSSPANASPTANPTYNVMRLAAQNANSSAQVAQYNNRIDLTRGLDFSTRIYLNSTGTYGNGFTVALRKADSSCQPFNGSYITSTAYSSGDGYLGTGSCSAFGVSLNNNGWFGAQIFNGGAVNAGTWQGLVTVNGFRGISLRFIVDDSATSAATRGVHMYVSPNTDLSLLTTAQLASYSCGTYCNALLTTLGGGSWTDDTNGYYLALTEGQSTSSENFDFWDTKFAAIDTTVSPALSNFTLANTYVALNTGTTTGTITAVDGNYNMMSALTASQVTFTGQSASAGTFANTTVTSTPGIFTTTYTSGSTGATVALQTQVASIALFAQPSITQQAACNTTSSLLVGDGVANDGTTAGQLYQIQTVTSGSSCIVVPPTSVTSVDILGVGGGGGGGADGGNGGAGGGIAYVYGSQMPAGGAVTVTVGTGGSGSVWGGSSSAGSATTVGLNSTTILTANGGSGALNWNNGGSVINVINGGTVTTASTYGGSWTTSSGGNGGQNVTNSAGSGGPGSAGIATYMTDSTIYYGGGGGGGICPLNSNIGGQLGGNGGGGDGAFYIATLGASRGHFATPYSGGGGGGGSACTPTTANTDKYNQRTNGGNGAGGVVVIRYAITPPATAPTVSAGLTWNQYATSTYDFQTRDNLYWNGSATVAASDTGSGNHPTVAPQLNYPTDTALTNNSNATGYVDHWSGWITIPGNPATNTQVSTTFTYNSDDGGFLQVGNKVGLTESVDNATFGLWTNDGATTYSSTAQTYLAGHSYPIDVWHYQNGGGAGFTLSWNLNCTTSPCVIPASAFSQTRPNDLYLQSTPVAASFVAGSTFTTNADAPVGGIGTLTYATSALPTGVSFTNGTFSANGLATLAGTFPVYETVTDSNGDSTSNLFNLTITPSTPSATTSTITLSPSTLMINTSATSTVTMQIKDVYGNSETGATITPVMNSLLSTYGSFTTPTYSSNGQYTSTFTVGSWAGGISIAPTESGTVFTNVATLYAVTCPNPSISGVTNTFGSAGSGYCYISFTAGSGNWSVPSGVTNVQALVVGGGGSGGNRGGGGGSAGGLFAGVTSATGGSNVAIAIGTGGLGLTTAATNNTSGNNGTATTFGTIVEAGGQGGAGGSGSGPTSGSGKINGASYSGYSQGAGTYSGSNVAAGGGAGSGDGVSLLGTGASASSVTASGNGGYGFASNISGALLCYAAGGGGGYGQNTGSAGSGGSCTGTTTTAGAGSNSNSAAGSAANNSGSGGGGGSFLNSANYGTGSGGSGVVIVKYISPTSVATNFDSLGDLINVNSNTVVILSEVDTAYSFTRTVLWQYSLNGTTWNTETATALNVSGAGTSNTGSTYSFAMRCGLHTGICATPTVQLFYRARILDTDGNGVSTYSYSPTITVNITALTSTPIALVGASANYGTPATLYTTGGGGTGAFVFPITAGGTATGCSVDSNKILHTTSAGTCLITPVQLGDLDYATDTGTVTTFTYYIYTQYVNTYQSQPGSHGIGGTIAGGGIGNTQTTGSTVLTVTGMTPTTGLAGTQVVLTGTGFSVNGVSQINTITFNSGFDLMTFVIDSPTQLTITLSAGETGVIDQFALQPINGATVFSPTFTGL